MGVGKKRESEMCKGSRRHNPGCGGSLQVILVYRAEAKLVHVMSEDTVRTMVELNTKIPHFRVVDMDRIEVPLDVEFSLLEYAAGKVLYVVETESDGEEQ